MRILNRYMVCLLATAGFAPCALAAPTYLTCMMPAGTGQPMARWDVTLDEAAGTARYAIPSMNVIQKYPAVFTADKVLFGSFEISRVDLTLTRTLQILDEKRIDTGQCSLAKPPQKRKF